MAIETNELIDVQTLTPFKKFIMTIGNIPTSYLESMSYAELLMWFCNYLQNTVIPTVNNNAEAVEELQGLYQELKSYVDNYFNNLDVQEEINNKLDNMVEDGTFGLLLAPYLQTFNNRLDLQDASIDNIQTQVNSVASGSPAGVYDTVSDLTTADPDHTKIYVVTATGKWYYYNNSQWNEGGTYQATQIADNSIDYKNLNSELKKRNPFTNLVVNPINGSSYVYNLATMGNGSYSVVNKPEGMNCTDEKVLKIDLPDLNSGVKIFPKFIQEFEYGKTIKFSASVFFEDNTRSYRFYIYKSTGAIGNQLMGYSNNGFISFDSIIVNNVQPNDEIDLRLFNQVNTAQTIYIADICCTYDTAINTNIGYNKKVLDKGLLPSHETNEIGVIFGDSIIQGLGVLTAGVIPTKDCVTVMNKELNTPIYNGGVAGAKFTTGRCSLKTIVDSIVNNSWTTFDTELTAVIATNNRLNSATTQFNKIKALNFANVGFIGLAYGTNDWASGMTLDNPNNPLDTTTILGGLRYSVSTLLTNYPQLKIYVFTPCYRDHLGDEPYETSDTYINPTSGLKLTDVCDGIYNCCKELHIPCKNMYYESNLNQYTRDEYLSDYVHRNEAGYKLLGIQYAKFIDSN